MLVAQEVMHHIQHSKSKQVTLEAQFDSEKAYDRVSWSFLQATLVEFNFPPAGYY